MSSVRSSSSSSLLPQTNPRNLLLVQRKEKKTLLFNVFTQNCCQKMCSFPINSARMCHTKRDGKKRDRKVESHCMNCHLKGRGRTGRTGRKKGNEEFERLKKKKRRRRWRGTGGEREATRKDDRFLLLRSADTQQEHTIEVSNTGGETHACVMSVETFSRTCCSNSTTGKLWADDVSPVRDRKEGENRISLPEHTNITAAAENRREPRNSHATSFSHFPTSSSTWLHSITVRLFPLTISSRSAKQWHSFIRNHRIYFTIIIIPRPCIPIPVRGVSHTMATTHTQRVLVADSILSSSLNSKRHPPPNISSFSVWILLLFYISMSLDSMTEKRIVIQSQ